MRGKSNVIKRNVEKVWGVRYTLGAHYLPKNTVLIHSNTVKPVSYASDGTMQHQGHEN
jgi:hypothetical protein